jgi:hypothetical protein
MPGELYTALHLSITSGSACLGHPFPRLLLAVGRQVVDLLALRLAALSACLRVLGPGAAIAAPTLTRVEPLRHVSTSRNL